MSYRLNVNTQPGLSQLIALCMLLCAVGFVPGSSCAICSDEGAKQLVGSRLPLDKLVAAKQAVGRLTEREEDDALKFAAKHHPELADLLQKLRKTSVVGFSRGIREVHLSIQRLERVREKQPARFQAELASWKVDSEIRLLTAKWLMSQDPELEKQICELLRQRQQTRIDRLKSERHRLTERLKQLDKQIGMGTTELEADLADEWSRLAKRAATTAKAQKNRSTTNRSSVKEKLTDKQQ